MKKRKYTAGEMLIETAVAMAIFAMFMTVSFSVYKTLSQLGNREEEFIRIESICLDIDEYYDRFGPEYFAEEYFGDYCYYDNKLGQYMNRYNGNYELVSSNNPDYTYSVISRLETLTREDGTEGTKLVVNIENIRTGKTIIKDLDYGESLASSKNDIEFYNAIMANNVGILTEGLDNPYDEPTGGDEVDE